MKQSKGAEGIMFNDIFFTETDIPKYPAIKHLEVVVKHQNATLDDIKRRLAEEAKSVGANTVKNFRYGQRIMSTLKALIRFQWVIEFWYGEGDAIRM